MLVITERGIRRRWQVQYTPGGGPHIRKGFVLQPGNWAEFDPFLGLMEDWFRQGTFEDHPHRGIETVTIVLEGHLEHRDNHGGAGLLGPGDLQWMTAGRGIIHAEDPVAGEVVHSLQLWLNLPRSQKMTTPRYQDLMGAAIPVRREPGALVRVFSGSSAGVTAPTLNHTPVTAVELRLDPGAQVTQDLPSSYNGFIYVLEGSGYFGVDSIRGEKGQVLWLGSAEGTVQSEVTVRAEGPLRALLMAGQPLGEPVAAYGPFVMNTEAEIRQAFADYRAGRFAAPVPR
jgi:redox-sensitive bicupin YhaK (pirin superfamily)